MAKGPVEVVEEQLEAYNARDLDRFAATYSGDIRIYRLPVKPSAYRFMLGDNSEIGIRW